MNGNMHKLSPTEFSKIFRKLFQKFSNTILTVILFRITDVNDNGPEFSSSLYEGSIAEGADIGASVLRVHATDRDTGDNAR